MFQHSWRQWMNAQASYRFVVLRSESATTNGVPCSRRRRRVIRSQGRRGRPRGRGAGGDPWKTRTFPRAAAGARDPRIGYIWHRLRHSVPLLWRFHQLHHSAERLDVSGAFLFHPIETVAVAFLISVTSTALLGVSTDAAAVAGTIGFFLACFEHANIRTPRWLGYLVQRPESHSIHHARGVHASNYADLPIYDILFGTFKNPADREPNLGFP
jgi:hypothetical protein